MKNKEMLGTEPIGKLLFKLSVPTVLAQLINMLYNVVDRIFIGRMPGEGDLALTGVGVCMPIIMLVSAFAALVSSGGAPRASIFIGKRDMESAERILGGCLALQAVISFALTALILIFNRPLLLAFGASENTIEYASSYLSVYAFGTLFVQLTLGMTAFVSAQGFTKVSMISVSIGALSNIILDAIFIYALDLGVRGAALATVISQGITTAFLISFLLGGRAFLKLKRGYIRLSPAVLLPCVGLGVATFVMQASESVISVAFNSSLYKHGGDIAVGAMTILASVMQFAMLPLQGFAQGSQPILSYNYGARNKERVVATFKLLLICCLGYSFLLWGSVMLFPRGFAALFTDKAELIDFTSRVIRIYFGGMLLFGIQTACQMTFVSLGNAPSSVLVAVVRKFVLLLPLIYIMPLLVADKTLGIYIAEPIADVVAVTFTAILFAFQFRKSIRKIGE